MELMAWRVQFATEAEVNLEFSSKLKGSSRCEPAVYKTRILCRKGNKGDGVSSNFCVFLLVVFAIFVAFVGWHFLSCSLQKFEPNFLRSD
jgi:hypothetical protein